MEDPEACLRALAAPLAQAKSGHPLPVTRFSLESVANAFVLLDILSADRAEAILAPYRPVLEAAGFQVGRGIGELAVQPATRAFQQARAAPPPTLRQVPLAVPARSGSPDDPPGVRALDDLATVRWLEFAATSG